MSANFENIRAATQVLEMLDKLKFEVVKPGDARFMIISPEIEVELLMVSNHYACRCDAEKIVKRLNDAIEPILAEIRKDARARIAKELES